MYRVVVDPGPSPAPVPELCTACDGIGVLLEDHGCDTVECERCGGTGEIERPKKRAPWAYWGATQCGVDSAVWTHRASGHTCISPIGCRVSGCRVCHSARRFASLEGLRGLRARESHRWYFATLTPPERITTYEERDKWLMQLRRTLGRLQAEGHINGAYVITEATEAVEYRRGGKTVPQGTPGAVARSAPWSRQPCPAREGWWRGQGECARHVGPQWEASCRAGHCSICDGRGWLPVAHLHAHVLIVARPFWYGARSLAESARDPGKVGRSARWAQEQGFADFEAPPDTVARYVAELGGVGHAFTDGAGRRRYEGDVPPCALCRGQGCGHCDHAGHAPLRVGMRGWLEGHGWRVFDFQSIETPDAASAYLSKIVSWYSSKVADSEHGALLLGAWMAGRRSAWAVGELFGLASARRKELGRDVQGLSMEDRAPRRVDELTTARPASESWVEGEPGKEHPRATVQVRRSTKRWKQLLNDELEALVFPVGVKSGGRADSLPLPLPMAPSTDDAGTVRVMGAGPLASVIVGGCVVGAPGERETAVQAVTRAYHRWTRGRWDGSWWDWWDRYAGLLQIPGAGQRRVRWGRQRRGPGDTRLQPIESDRGRSLRVLRGRRQVARVAGSASRRTGEHAAGWQADLFGGFDAVTAQARTSRSAAQAPESPGLQRRRTIEDEPPVVAAALVQTERPSIAVCRQRAEAMVTAAGWPAVEPVSDAELEGGGCDYSLLGLVDDPAWRVDLA